MRSGYPSLVAAAALALACNDAQRPPSLPQAPVATQPSATPSAATPSTPEPELVPDPPPDEVLNAPPPERTPVPGSTRGTIACGDRRCKAGTEMCARDARSFACVPPEPGPAEFRSARYRCDDGSDCQDGEACCITFRSPGENYACVPRSRVGEECALEVCDEGGAACPAGLSCQDGACTTLVRAECGPKRERCSAERPICSFRRSGSQCVTPEETDVLFVEYGDFAEKEPGGVFSCSRGSDCGGGQKCCAANGGRLTYCAPSCDVDNGMRVCAKVAECTELRDRCGKDAGCLAAVRCATQPVSPPWIKMCTSVPAR